MRKALILLLGFILLATGCKSKEESETESEQSKTEQGDSPLDKYARKTKTTEAIDQLSMIYRGAAEYYMTPRVVLNTGQKIPCQFPVSTEITPPLGACCSKEYDKDQDGRCDSRPEMWDAPTWSALKFAMMDPHYFSYQFEWNGKTGADAEFTATAYGDLDCDGVYSTFQRYGRGDVAGGYGECSLESAPAFFVENETE